MANRIPLIINSSAQQIQELPSGDDLIGITDITVTGTSTADSFVGKGTVPIGGIIIWSGSIASIPSNFQLCDGAAAATSALQAITGANVPNLEDKFVVGAHQSTAPGTAVNASSASGIGGLAFAFIIRHT